jgi:hypothetical protein
MDEQYKKMLEQLAEIRKKHRQDPTIPRPTITSIGGGINMDFASLYPSTMTYHFGGNKSRRILKVKKILKNIKENDTK